MVAVLLLLVLPLAGCLDDPVFRDSSELEPDPEPVRFQECDQMHLFVPAQASDFGSYVPEGFQLAVVPNAEDLVLLPAWFSRCIEFTGMNGYLPEFDFVGEAWITVPVHAPDAYGLAEVGMDVVPVRAIIDGTVAPILQDWGLDGPMEAGDVGMLLSAQTGNVNGHALRSILFQADGSGWAWDATAELYGENTAFSGDPFRIWIPQDGQATDFIQVEPLGGEDRGSGGAALTGDWPAMPEGAPGAVAHAVRGVDFTWTLGDVTPDA